MLKNIIFLLSETYYNSIIQHENILLEKVLPYGTKIRFISYAEPGYFKDPDTAVPMNDIHFLLPETDDESRESLFITDTPTVFYRLQDSGSYTLALYHEHNRDCSFPGALYAVEDIFQLEYSSYDEAYRRLANIPWDILETGRMIVRESTVADISAFYNIYQDPAVTAYTEPLYSDPLEETAYLKDYIKQVYGFYGFGIWTVILKETGEIIGRAGLNVREGYDLPELGFVIDASHWRQGLCFEVCSAILDHAKNELEFSKVQAFVQEGNIPSRRLLEKLGFNYEKEVSEKGQDYLLYTCQLSFAYEEEI